MRLAAAFGVQGVCVRRSSADRSGRRAWPLMAAALAAAAPADTALVDAARTGDAAGRARAAAPKARRRERRWRRRHDAAALGGAARRCRDGRAAGPRRARTSRRQNRYGVQPLSLAAVNGNAEVVSAAARGRRRSEHRRWPAARPSMMTAARAGNGRRAESCSSTHGANVNAADARGQTALMWAAARNNAAAIRAAGRGGADLTVRTNNPAPGRRPRQSACSPARRRPASPRSCSRSAPAASTRVRALLDAGADVNDTLSDGESALVVATANAHWEVAELPARPRRRSERRPARAGTPCTRPCTAAVRTSAIRRVRCRPATLDSIDVDQEADRARASISTPA